MPKLSILRWPVGVILALLLVLGASLSWGGLHPWRMVSPLAALSALFDGDDHGGERREFELLQAALQRIETELHQQANAGALASLRIERDAVIQRAREAASRLPAASLSPDIQRLIASETVSPPVPATAAVITPGMAHAFAAGRIEAAAPARPPAELRVGLRPPVPANDFSGLALEPRPPWPLFAGHKPARRTTPPAPPTERAETQQSVR